MRSGRYYKNAKLHPSRTGRPGMPLLLPFLIVCYLIYFVFSTPAFAFTKIESEQAPLSFYTGDLQYEQPLDMDIEQPEDTELEQPLDSELEIPEYTNLEVPQEIPMEIPVETLVEIPEIPAEIPEITLVEIPEIPAEIPEITFVEIPEIPAEIPAETLPEFQEGTADARLEEPMGVQPEETASENFLKTGPVSMEEISNDSSVETVLPAPEKADSVNSAETGPEAAEEVHFTAPAARESSITAIIETGNDRQPQTGAAETGTGAFPVQTADIQTAEPGAAPTASVSLLQTDVSETDDAVPASHSEGFDLHASISPEKTPEAAAVISAGDTRESIRMGTASPAENRIPPFFAAAGCLLIILMGALLSACRAHRSHISMEPEPSGLYPEHGLSCQVV